jgi:hypothetical protein
MAAILIPAYGEAFLPYTRMVKKVSFGFSSDLDVQMTTTGSFKLFTPTHGVFVENMILNKITAFTTGGTITIGDTDVDGYFLSSDALFSDAGIKNMKHVSTAFGATLPAYIAGRYYSSDASDTMAINAIITTTAPLAGKAYLYCLYFYEGVI